MNTDEIVMSIYQRSISSKQSNLQQLIILIISIKLGNIEDIKIITIRLDHNNNNNLID